MKESLIACYELDRYFREYPDAPESDPIVIALRKIINKMEEEVKGVAVAHTVSHRIIIDDNAIIDLHNKGMSTVLIAKELGYSQSIVSRHLVKLGLGRSDRDRKLDQEILKMHKDGLTRTAMAAKVGINYNKINNRCKKLGLKPNKRKKTELSPARVRKEMVKGLTIKEIAEAMKTSTSLVVDTMKKNGMKTRYDEIQQLKHRYVFILDNGGYHQYNNLDELKKAEYLNSPIRMQEMKNAGRVLTRFDWLQKWGVKG